MYHSTYSWRREKTIFQFCHCCVGKNLFLMKDYCSLSHGGRSFSSKVIWLQKNFMDKMVHETFYKRVGNSLQKWIQHLPMLLSSSTRIHNYFHVCWSHYFIFYYVKAKSYINCQNITRTLIFLSALICPSIFFMIILLHLFKDNFLNIMFAIVYFFSAPIMQQEKAIHTCQISLCSTFQKRKIVNLFMASYCFHHLIFT